MSVPPANDGWMKRDPYHQARLQGAIAECAQRFAESRDLHDILRDAVAIIRDHIGLDRAGIFLYDEDSREWHGVYGTDVNGTARDERDIPIPADRRHPLRRAEAGEGWEFFSEDFQREFPDDPFMAGVKNHYLVALRAHDHLMGCISVDNLLTGRPIDEETREDMRRLARFVALALENVKLLGRLEERNAALSRELEARTKLEAEREAALADLRRANEDLKDFAHVVSHDLKSPLQSTTALVEWIAEDYRDRLDDDGVEKLIRVRHRLAQMGALIEGILRYSRADKAAGEPEKVYTAKLVSEVIDLIAPGPNVKVHVQPDLPEVWYDRIQLQQVFQNILSNAVTYMDKPRGTIWVSCVEAGDAWEFAVRDTGHGIAEEHLGRIFKMFYSVGVSGLKESTGIGLAVVKKIIEHNGGRIRVETKLGEGSCFFFTVPKMPVKRAE